MLLHLLFGDLPPHQEHGVVDSAIIQIITSTPPPTSFRAKGETWERMHSRWDSDETTFDIPPRKFASRLQLMKGPEAREIFQQSLVLSGEELNSRVNPDCVCAAAFVCTTARIFSKKCRLSAFFQEMKNSCAVTVGHGCRVGPNNIVSNI